VRRLAAALLIVLLVAGCTQKAPHETPVAAPPGDRYVALAHQLNSRGVQIWWESDLVTRWLEGKPAFEKAVARLGDLARQPGTAGFKIADELGYGDRIDSADQARRFLVDAREALTRVAPGKQLLIDVVVPELGCVPWHDANGTACAVKARQKDPAASVDSITSYLREHLVDRLDVSAGLLDASAYTGRGLTRPQAQQAAWQHIVEQGWPRLTVLQARKALAAANGYQGSDADAASDVALYIEEPVSAGAKAVDIWTWRQPYSGATVSLLATDLSPNALWTALSRTHEKGVQLITHMTPSSMPADPNASARECDLVASVFTAVFVAAGTG
jgi:hypothetical protein